MKKIITVLTRTSFLIFCVLFAVSNILISTYQINNDLLIENHIQQGITFSHIGFVIILILIAYLIYRSKLNNTILICIVLMLFLVIGSYWILTNDVVHLAYDDTFKCIRDAKLILSKDYSPLDFKSYLNKYPYNLGIVSYFMVHLKLFKDNFYYSLRFTNLFLVLMAYFSLYKISDMLFGNKVSRLTIILILLNFQLVFLSYDIYGYAASFSLIIISLYFLIKFLQTNQNSNLILMYMAIMFAILIKNNALIVLIAESIYLFFYLIRINKVKLILVSIFILIGQYTMTSGIIKFYESRVGYSISHNKLPKIMWVAIGLNYEEKHIGGYFELAETAHEKNDFVVEYTKKDAMEYIKHSIERFKNNPIKIYDFYRKKFFQAYTNPEYDSLKFFRELNQTEFNQRVISGDINGFIKKILDASLSLISLCLIFNLKKLMKLKYEELTLAMIIVGGLLFS